MKKFIEEVKAFYPQYMLQHQNKWNRRFHLIGNTLTLGWFLGSLVIMAFISFFYGLGMLAISPFLVYPFAWVGHLVFEKNKQATWSKNAFITKVCDWLMIIDILNGKIKL